MPHHARPPCGPIRRIRRRARSRAPLRNALAALFCLVTLSGLPHQGLPHQGDAPADAAGRPARAAVAAPGRFARLFDPAPLSGADARAGWRGAPLASTFPAAAPASTLAAIEARAVPAAGPARPARSAPETDDRTAQRVPLPVARPSERLAAAPAPRMAVRQVARRARAAHPPEATGETPSFFEALFGARRETGPALAYAALESDTLDTRRAGRLVPAPAEGGTAVYDISARVVRLPSGEVLEAHSGLGDRQDDPNGVHVRMRGATPPGTYDLTEREQLFHGVRALRLNPVGGSAAIHGRDGLLAHTYMLGPGGASNGCVSFRDYNRFLQAYLRGEVRRLVVVSGRWQDGPPRLANRRLGMPGRPDAQPGDG